MHTFLTEYFMTNLPADTVRRIEDAAAALIAAGYPLWSGQRGHSRILFC